MNIVVQCFSHAEVERLSKKLGTHLPDDGEGADFYLKDGKYAGWVLPRNRGWFERHDEYPVDKTMTAAEYLNEGGWIRRSDQEPSPGRRVLLATRGLKYITYVDNFTRAGENYIYWLPVTLPPEPTEPDILVGAHKVIFNPDGSLQVGCTKVTSNVFDKIVERRADSLRK